MKQTVVLLALTVWVAGIALQLYTVNVVNEMAQHSESEKSYYASRTDTQRKIIEVLEDPNQKGGSLIGIYKRQLRYADKPTGKQFPTARAIAIRMKASYAMIILSDCPRLVVF